MSKFLKRKIVVDGEEITLDVDLDMPIIDVDNDMRRVTAQMAYWGAVMGAAEREKEAVDAFYRRWRAKRQEEILATEEGKKLAEYKIKSIIESDDKFLELKDAYAQTCEAFTTSKNTFEALGRKANLLQSMGAKLRTELEAGRKVVTRVRPESAAPATAPSTSDDEDDDTRPDDGDEPSVARDKLSALKAGMKKAAKAAKE